MVKDWLALIGKEQRGARLAAGRAGGNEDLFRYGPRGPWWRSARRQDQRAGGASNCRRHALLALHPPYHAEGAVKQGASRAAVAETLAMAVYMGAGPSVMYAAQALEAVDQITAKAG